MSNGVEVIENEWITLADGCRLAARIWRPDNALDEPVPALLEFLPYRKRDFMRHRDEPMHGYFAAHGYASVRVDLRGSGDSDGLLSDEYTLQEHADGAEVIGWLAAQPWCSGKVGMFGISWGGFNALQVAALQPPALQAIISLCASDDRYSDDAHYMGGCLLTENLQWGSIFMVNQALPADPEIVGEAWRAQWRERLENLPNFPELWTKQQWRGDYWREGSVSDHIERIKVPVYAIGGWADGYSNAVPRLLSTLQSPSKGLIGPWAHNFPHQARPGPEIGFLQEALRWWDRWLKDIDNGIEREPRLRVWLQEAVKPEPQYDTIPGRWIAEPEWPSNNITASEWFLSTNGCTREPGEAEEQIVSSPQSCGIRGGEWCAFGSDGEMPRDQRPDDGFSQTWDTPRLKERIEILGAPRVRLVLRSDQPTANLIVRVCDVAPDGTSLRVSYGVLNLTHRNSHAEPAPLVPGEQVTVNLQLNDIAHAFPKGHRIRVGVSTAYWPIVWPSSSTPCLHIMNGESVLTLPVRKPREEDARLQPFEAPAMGESGTMKRVRLHQFSRKLAIDLTTNRFHYELNGTEFSDASLVHLEDIDLRIGYTMNKCFEIGEDDPLSAKEIIEVRSTLTRGGWRVTIRLSMTQTADADTFFFNGRLEADEGTERFFERDFNVRVPRRLV